MGCLRIVKEEKTLGTIKIVCAAIYVFFIVGTLVTVDNVGQYVDLPAFLVVVVMGVLFAVTAKGDESIVQKFGNGAVRTGWLRSIIGVLAVFVSDDFASGDTSQIGIALAVVFLTIFYGYFLKLGSMMLD